MRRTEQPREIRKIRFEEAYERQNAGRLTPPEAAQLLGLCSAVSGGAWCAMKPTGWQVGRRLELVSRRRPQVAFRRRSTRGREQPMEIALHSGHSWLPWYRH